MKSSHASLDEHDAFLLDLLQHDATRTIQALAEAAGLSPATCHRRVRRLHEEGWIEKVVAIASADRLHARQGHGLHALVEVTLESQTVDAQDRFERLVVAHAAVQQCWRLATGPDFLLVIHAADMQAYQAVTQDLFRATHGVRNVRAFFASRRSKFSTVQPARAAPSKQDRTRDPAPINARPADPTATEEPA